MIFLLMIWEKESFVIYDCIKLWQGKRTQRADGSCDPPDVLAGQLRSPGPGLTWWESAKAV